MFQGDSNSSSQIVSWFSKFVTNFHNYPSPRHPESSRIFGNLKVKAILDTNPFVSPGVRMRGWIGWMGAVHFNLRGKEDPFFNQNASCVLGCVFVGDFLQIEIPWDSSPSNSPPFWDNMFGTFSFSIFQVAKPMLGKSHAYTFTPWKLTCQWNTHHLKMYFLLKMGISQCHVSFQECI